MRRFVLAVFFAGLCVRAALAVEITTHTVVSGDTLWDLSARYYRNAWHWPKIWDANKSTINDPDKILPGQIVTIPPASTPMPVMESAPLKETVPQAVEEVKQPADVKPEAPAAVPQEVAAPQEEAAAPPEPAAPAADEEEFAAAEEEPAAEPEKEAKSPSKESAVPWKALAAESFVAPADWKGEGNVTGDKDKKILIATGDTVYINIGADLVKPGTKCMVYRVIGRVRDRKTGRLLGKEVRRIARLEVTEGVGKAASAAKVTMSFDPLEIGDIVKIVKDDVVQ